MVPYQTPIIARGNDFGTFHASVGGNLIKMKLVHLYGYVSCTDGTKPELWSYWGCGYFDQKGIKDWSVVSVTYANNTVILPPEKLNRGSYKMALQPGYSSRDPEFVMSVFYDQKVLVTVGEEFRVWYSEDLFDIVEDDNSGKVCADVYGYFMK